MPAEDPGWIPRDQSRSPLSRGRRARRARHPEASRPVHALGVGADRRCADGQRDDPPRAARREGLVRRVREDHGACRASSRRSRWPLPCSRRSWAARPRCTRWSSAAGCREPRCRPAFRKMLRPRGRLARTMLPAGREDGRDRDARAGAQRRDALGCTAAAAARGRHTRKRDRRDPSRRLGRHGCCATRGGLSFCCLLLALLIWLAFGWSVALAVLVVAGAALGLAYARAAQQRPRFRWPRCSARPTSLPRPSSRMPPQPGYVYTPPADDPLLTVAASSPPLPGADSARCRRHAARAHRCVSGASRFTCRYRPRSPRSILRTCTRPR